MACSCAPRVHLASFIKYGGAVCLTGLALLIFTVFSDQRTKPTRVEATEETPPTPIITLFTTFKPNPKRLSIYQATIRNWASLGPHVRPLLYANLTLGKSDLVEYALQHGWSVAQTPKENWCHTPFVNHMYMDAEQRYDSEFYSYANGDILFDDGLVRTLNAVLNKMPQKRVLVIGQRVNYELKNYSHIPYSTIDEFRSNRQVMARSVKWGLLLAIDFFITRRAMFSWNRMAHVVVGRGGYDAYVLYYAMYRDNGTVISATDTMQAYHLQAMNWQLSHRKDKDKDSHFNVKAIKDRENGTVGKVWNTGTIRAARMKTVLGENGEIDIIPQTKKTRTQMSNNKVVV
ncbi:hypothetical protein CAPTEDRAFT_226064 [Capitella teleta]|uniref:Uncharacterized protein n=1 Tax=Capitella teleta TaxID=283909 RepID=R7UQM1_CAPTE|nr:hypothetical protein CAPTEDRAFT_226064 [Capitella teleta]|eukprot:ELU08480.1 hypothetical protein CAPTEDRAFT_226064 [Capitella teleta]